LIFILDYGLQNSPFEGGKGDDFLSFDIKLYDFDGVLFRQKIILLIDLRLILNPFKVLKLFPPTHTPTCSRGYSNLIRGCGSVSGRANWRETDGNVIYPQIGVFLKDCKFDISYKNEK